MAIQRKIGQHIHSARHIPFWHKIDYVAITIDKNRKTTVSSTLYTLSKTIFKIFTQEREHKQMDLSCHTHNLTAMDPVYGIRFKKLTLPKLPYDVNKR